MRENSRLSNEVDNTCVELIVSNSYFKQRRASRGYSATANTVVL